MKNTLFLFLVLILFLSCGKSDDGTPSLDGECHGIINFAPPAIFNIELVDSVGTNSIEDGYCIYRRRI